MKFKILLSVVAALIVTTGCVKTVSGRNTTAVPFMKDQVEGRYERPAAQVFQASKDVIRDNNGTLAKEVTQHSATNALIFSLEGRVQERRVFIAVQEVEPRISQITVQVRTSSGGRDIDLAHELEKQVALKLVR